MAKPLARALLIALPALAATALARAEPLESVVRFALENHPRTRAAAAGAEASGYQLQQARAARAPQLGLFADPGRAFQGSGGRPAEIGDLGLRGSLLLFDGGRTRESIAREEGRLQAADATLRLTGEELATRVVDVYLEWYKQDRLAELAADNVAAHEALHERVRQIASFDRGRGSDLVQVGARLQQARVILAGRRGAANEARAVLVDLVGRDVDAVEAPREPARALPASLPDAIAALDSHPAARGADAQADAARHAWGAASAWMLPRIDLQAGVDSPRDLAGERRYFDDYSVRLGVSWLPLDGGSGRAGARAAQQQYVQAQEGARAVRRDLSARVAELWTQLDTRRERAAVYRELVDQAVQVREAYWQQFTIGRRSIIDLLNAETEAFQARQGAEGERLELLQAQYRLLGTSATLTSWLGIAAAPLADAAEAAEAAGTEQWPAPKPLSRPATE
ncbi:MAG: TolC family protein [Steroidobacteraceae bacterium]|nr:TolC family protein [Steroidobacteraceae bacterium]